LAPTCASTTSATPTHASWLLAGGADLKVVMNRMGHAQLATTQRYLHTLPDADD
jgi:site-specific recombinase XerD